MSVKYQLVPVTSFQENTIILWCEKTHRAVIVDPGGEADKLIAIIDGLPITVERILLTHGHLDHVGAAVALAQHYQVQIWGPQQEDTFLFESLSYQSEQFGLPRCANFMPDRWLLGEESLTLGDNNINVLHCPGHTPGHIVFFFPESRLCLVGDVLFSGSIGRTDFPLGDYRALERSIKMTLFPLGDDIAFISGHGPMSTFGHERKYNPYVGEKG